MLLDGSEMDSFADLTHTPQGDVKNEAMFSLLPKFKNLTHPPQGDVNTSRLSKKESSSEPTHTPQGDDNSSMLSSSSSVTGINSHPARGRKPIPVDKDDNQAFGFNSHPARGHNGRAFSALHECGRKGSFAFLKIYSAVFPTGTAAEPFSGCKTETPETKGQSL